LFDVVLDLLPLLGDRVDVVIETWHYLAAPSTSVWRRSEIDRVVLTSYLCAYEDLLTHDGCTAIACIATGRPLEIQLDEHKLLHIYAQRLHPFQRRLHRWGIHQHRHLPFICETAHLHRTRPQFPQQLHQLLHHLAAEPI
jgi:hypothetical protein